MYNYPILFLKNQYVYLDRHRTCDGMIFAPNHALVKEVPP